jgi:RNA polymerase sigma-70 factor
LERDILAKLPSQLDPKLPPAVVDEVCQMVRIHLLLGTGTGPQLNLYKGEGSLPSWIRVIATRMSLKQVAPVRKVVEENVLAAIEAMPAPGADTELDLIKRRCLHEFRAAARDAFATLPRRQRYLLRLHFIDQLSTIKLGEMYGVDQSTASRWLKSARQAVYEETKRLLKERLRLSSHEFESLLSDIHSRLDLSFSQILKEEEEEKLRQAVREALSVLTGEQRRVLRLHFVDQRPPAELSGLQGALQAVYEETKRRFSEGLGSSSQVREELLGNLHGHIDLLLRQLLKEGWGEA